MLMHRARREIEVSARMLVRDPYPQVPTEQNKKTWERFHADIWTGWAEVADCEDKVGKKLADFRARMEGLCRPIVDRHPTKSKHRIFRKRPIARD